ncbi:MAG: NUDIX domain-containing protein [Tannerellaceae bacterium]|nr:NUDIX domain-containing protein [Tannerellaceae bacterium]
MEKVEYFPLVDEQGQTIGKATRQECHSGTKWLHPVVHLHVFNAAGELYLQKRAIWKDIQPGKWDTAVGGHVDYGERVEEALKRETREELGITSFEPVYITSYVFESEIEKELVNAFRTVYTGAIYPCEEEIEEGGFWSIQEIEENLGKGIFTPNFENEYRKILQKQSN